MADLLRAGMTLAQIAELFGVAVKTVWSHGRRRGVRSAHPRGRPRSLTTARAVDMVRDGATVVEAAMACRISRNAVAKACGRAGVIATSHTAAEREAIVQEYLAGDDGFGVIARRHRIGVRALAAWLREADVSAHEVER